MIKVIFLSSGLLITLDDTLHVEVQETLQLMQSAAIDIYCISINTVLFLLTDPDGFDFMIISLDNSTWLFEAQTMEVS